LNCAQRYYVELNVKKILAVINATYAVAKRKPEKNEKKIKNKKIKKIMC